MIHPRLLAAVLVAAALWLLPGAAAADAQDVVMAVPEPHASDQPNAGTSPRVSWLSTYGFHLTAASIRTDDPRFNWDAHFGGNLDLVDYGIGRLTLLADYEVIIGSERRTIDPNQAAYRLDVSTSLRAGAVEVQALYRHVSRHLSDRENPVAISWNDAGVGATARLARRTVAATVSAYGAKVVQAALVDYTWQFGVYGDVQYRLKPAAALIARAFVAPTLVDEQVAGRGPQVGGRVESGVRLSGTAGALDLFVAWERRLDPYPLERSTGSWALLGFRFVHR